jgi:hypothetical protein
MTTSTTRGARSRRGLARRRSYHAARADQRPPTRRRVAAFDEGVTAAGRRSTVRHEPPRLAVCGRHPGQGPSVRFAFVAVLLAAGCRSRRQPAPAKTRRGPARRSPCLRAHVGQRSGGGSAGGRRERAPAERRPEDAKLPFPYRQRRLGACRRSRPGSTRSAGENRSPRARRASPSSTSRRAWSRRVRGLGARCAGRRPGGAAERLIIPLPPGERAQPGDLVLTSWASVPGCAGHRRRGGTAEAPRVAYLDLDYDHPSGAGNARRCCRRGPSGC